MPVSVGVGRVASVPGVSFTSRRVPYDSVDALVLINELQGESSERYGGPDQTPVDPAEFADPNGAFFIARYGVDRIPRDGPASDAARTHRSDVSGSFFEGSGPFDGPNGHLDAATGQTVLVGCVGMRRHSDSDAELKRMYIRRPFRGRGWSRELLRLVETQALSMGFVRLILETGTPQPEAIGLYESSGYESIPGFGHYRDEPLNRCYAKQL